MNYDTAEIRRVARQLKGCASTVGSIEQSKLRTVLSMLGSEFKGQAADAATKRIQELSSDLLQLQNGINAIGDELNQFARQLDIADERSKSHIHSH